MLLVAGAACAQGIITTVAGGTQVFRGDGGRGVDATLGEVHGVAADSLGNLYASDWSNHLVVKIAPSGILTVVAGNGIAGFSGDGGPGVNARLNYPEGLAIDRQNNLYIADSGNTRVRKLTPAGIITTVAGNGGFGYSGEGGPATSASLSAFGVWVDTADNLYIADRDNNRILRVTAGGIINSIAGNGTRGFSGDGGPATTAMFNAPIGVAVDAAGNIYVADTGNRRLRSITPGGTMATVAGDESYGPGTVGAFTPGRPAVDASGNVVVPIALHTVYRLTPTGSLIPSSSFTLIAGGQGQSYSGDGGLATAASLNTPTAVALGATGQLYIADTGNGRVRRVDATGPIATIAGSGLRFAGDGGPATSAQLNQPEAVIVGPGGGLFIADAANSRVRLVAGDGTITTVAGTGLLRFTGDGGPATAASFNRVSDLAFDGAGNLYVLDFGNKKIRRIDTAGAISSILGEGPLSPCGAAPAGLAVDAAGNLFVADAVQHRICKRTPGGTVTFVGGAGVAGFSGDGGLATAAALNGPGGIAVDAAGTLYVADTFNGRVRKISAAGVITTLGVGTRPKRVAIGASGNVFFTDGNSVRRIDPTGTITTLAGTGGYGFSGDGGPASSALLSDPYGLAVDTGGNLYIADRFNNRIRKVLAAAASFTAAPANLSFAATAGAAETPAPSVTLSSATLGLAWTAATRTASGSWLKVAPASGAIPATLTVSVDLTGLGPGTYTGSVEITVPAAAPAVQTVAVTLTVSAPQPARLVVNPASLSFQATSGFGAPAAQSLRIENAGDGALAWTASATSTGATWLTLSATSGNAPARIDVGANPSALPAGSYSGAITVTSSTTGQTLSVPVSLRVSRPAGELLLSQTGLFFRAVQQGGAEPPQALAVLNTGQGTVNWTARATAPWLRVSPVAGQSETLSTVIPEITVSVDPTGLVAGFYAGIIEVTSAGAANSPQLLKVDLQVFPPGTPLGAVVRPTGVVFVARAGGAAPPSQEIRVGTTSGSLIEFTSLVVDGPWVSRTPEIGTASTSSLGRIVVQPEVAAVGPGVYRAALGVFTRNDGVLHPVSLLFLVLPAGSSAEAGTAAEECTHLVLQLASVFSNFSAAVGFPTALSLNARDNCGNPAVGGTMLATFSSGDPPLALTDLRNGQYQGTWRPNQAASQVVVRVRGAWRGLSGETQAVAGVGGPLNPQGAILAQGGVLLGAGFEAGPVAPGSVISLFGQRLAAQESLASALPLPRRLAGLRVLASGREAPLFYAGPGQVNAQVPTDLPAGERLQIQIEANNIPTAPEPLETAATRPGIFTLGGSFGNQGAILIANTPTLAMPMTAGVPSQPVERGGVVSIYCTGLGATNPAVPSGEAAPPGTLALVTESPAVTIGGLEAPVLFAGLAPGFAGVYQVNVRVPDSATPGSALPVVITQAGTRSNVATIAVQ
jgi:uncharacterized protein (TIGR03437 family)